MIITGRDKSAEVIERIRSHRTSLPIFCTASHWNTEAILLAARRTAEKLQIRNIPVSVAMTFNYRHMPQARRVTHTGDARLGFLSVMAHLMVLAGDPSSPYYDVHVLPHLDHADPEADRWALIHCPEYLSSVMFDAQRFPPERNIEMTREYVKNYRDRVLIEGIMDTLSVHQSHEKQRKETEDDYPERAGDYVKRTGVDFLVADLGTEQQSQGIGDNSYMKQRAREITRLAGGRLLVLHGTSCLSDEEIATLPDDGILRVNMWTRIVREAGLYAFKSLKQREDRIHKNDFDAVESHRYLMDSTEKAACLMEVIMESLGYGELA